MTGKQIITNQHLQEIKKQFMTVATQINSTSSPIGTKAFAPIYADVVDLYVGPKDKLKNSFPPICLKAYSTKHGRVMIAPVTYDTQNDHDFPMVVDSTEETLTPDQKEAIATYAQYCADKAQEELNNHKRGNSTAMRMLQSITTVLFRPVGYGL